MKTRSYKEVVDSQILMASSNVRSVSLITPRGTLRQFRMREDVTLLLNTKEMADLVRSVDLAASSFYKFLPKLGLLRHLYLDFDDLHALVFLYLIEIHYLLDWKRWNRTYQTSPST